MAEIGLSSMSMHHAYIRSDVEFHAAIFGGECRQKRRHLTQNFSEEPS
jgi:hypothetical protein